MTIHDSSIQIEQRGPCCQTRILMIQGQSRDQHLTCRNKKRHAQYVHLPKGLGGTKTKNTYYSKFSSCRSCANTNFATKKGQVDLSKTIQINLTSDEETQSKVPSTCTYFTGTIQRSPSTIESLKSMSIYVSHGIRMQNVTNLRMTAGSDHRLW